MVVFQTTDYLLVNFRKSGWVIFGKNMTAIRAVNEAFQVTTLLFHLHSLHGLRNQKDPKTNSVPVISNLYGNAGLDEILEVGTYKDVNDTHRVQRTLIQFYTTQIQSTLHNKVTGQWTGSLHLSLAVFIWNSLGSTPIAFPKDPTLIEISFMR